MKKCGLLICALVTFICVAVLSPVAVNAQDNHEHHAMQEKKKEKDLYQCPMKCEPPTDKPGKCGKCGMNLKKIEPAATVMYQCPMKCEPPTDKPGKCGKCGMNLKKIEPAAATVLYECPMKCEPATDKPGKCGKCGMDLKKKAK